MLLSLLSDVATTYIGIRTLQTQLAITHENVAKQRKALEIANVRYHGGTATELDVYQAENVLKQTQAAVPQLTLTQLQRARTLRRVLLGMTPEACWTPGC